MNSDLFIPGKLTFIMDGQFGSSGKGKIASYIGEKHKGEFTFACNAFSAQAGHWVKLEDGKSYFYQHLNSIAYNHSLYEKMYIGAASCIELPAILREIEENNIREGMLGISPLASIITDCDMEYEKGMCGFDPKEGQGEASERHDGTAKFGSTAHGVGSCTARKVLRRPSVVLARDVPELRGFLCDVPEEIMARLGAGEAGLCEIAQGFPLSMNHRFYPYCTSRCVTVSQALSDMFLPPFYAGKVVINLRTFPIRINSRKFICTETGKHLTWTEVQEGKPHEVYEGSSGGWYPDQSELTWEDITRQSGSPDPIFEITSVTKLPRRVATFSKENLLEAIRYNHTGAEPILSLNFANYVDANMTGKRSYRDLTPKFVEWMEENLGSYSKYVRYIGTGALTEDIIDSDWRY